MNGLRIPYGRIRRRLKDERGWALIDAVASSVVVVLAFVGTTMAFNGSTASVARGEKKTQALVIAQDSLNQMRSIGQRDIELLTSMNNTSKTVTYENTQYTVQYSAYYVTGLGSDQQDACKVAYASGGGSARYIYMRAKVTYAGQTTAASTNPSPYLTAPASLDSYYSPEGGGVQADTGTLRVYVLDRNNNPATGLGDVYLYVAGNGTEVAHKTPDPSTGCVLFTGLTRNTYEVTVTAYNKQDLFMTNSSSLNKIVLPVVMPDRGALSREIRVDGTVNVTPKFYTNTGTSGSYEVRSSSGSTNAYFGTGNWIAGTDDIKSAPSADYSYLPSGISYMPHINTATAATQPNAMFPLSSGYSGYAGPCAANNPNAGAASGVNNFVQVPATLGDTNWAPNKTYTPQFWLSQIRGTVTTSSPGRPSDPLNNGSTYYYDQTISSTGAQVWVRLVSDASGSTTDNRCRSNFTNLGEWVKLPGSITSSGGYLSDEAEALPVGMYDVCIKTPYRYTQATVSGSWVWGGFWTGWVWQQSLGSGSTSNSDSWRYEYFDHSSLGPLGYRSSLAPSANYTWNTSSSAPTSGQTTSCTS